MINMRGFTLIELIVSMALIAISVLAIFESLNSISDTILQNKDLNYLIHFTESKFNKFNSIKTNVYSFSGDVTGMDYMWTYIEDDLGFYNIIRQSIVIQNKNNDFKILELYEYNTNK
ncbi:hypothetical protein JCM12298_09420 [Desulfothermus naphthae]